MDNYSGWEGYYNSNEEKSIWKEDVELFLIENKDLLLPNQKTTVLDIACGDGRNTEFFCCKNNFVCCVDISETALKKLGCKYPQTVRICEEFTKTTLCDNQFDVVICFDGLAQMLSLTW